jgi:NADP-dependent 3-hydroxy acid dehydrogenase YdfG
MSELEGRVALVTGASGGIGGAIALALARAGARLLLAGRDAERLAELAARARRSSPRLEVRPADLAADTEVEGLVSRLLELFGGVDVLVHSAGAFAAGPIESTNVGELDRLYRINLRAPYFLTQALLPSLRERRGQVVFVNSSVTGRATVGPYAALKHALKAIADSLREEVNRDGVRVLSVFPGRTASAMQEEVHRFEGRIYHPERMLQPEDVAASVVHALALPRTAEVTDLHLRPLRPWAEPVG